MQKNVITGGPCTGKTTLIDALERIGYPVVREAARIIIEGGMKPYTDPAAFQEAVVKKQIELEAAIKQKRVFLDRCLVDYADGYYRVSSLNPPERFRPLIRDRYKRVFFLEPLSFYETDGHREESPEKAKWIRECLLKAYKDNGYEVVKVPEMSVEKRIGMILKESGMIG